MSAPITIERLAFPTPWLESVTALHRQNSKTLGFFPAGAFEENARLRRVLVAIDGSKLLGYLLYRVARGRATIVHLCIAHDARERGVARLLVERLKAETKPLEGIGLQCRRDYDIGHMWSKFGFEAVNSKAGRGKDGAELVYWWFGHGHADLFSTASDPRRQRLVIDANVFFDLHASESRECDDSKALLADWVQSSIELVITKELRNEIEKAPTDEQRRWGRAEATRYTTLTGDDTVFQSLCTELRPLFPASTTLRDDADLRQIAYAICGGAPFFATRDQTLIERCEPLYRSHGLMVLHPAEFINHLDSLEREADYKPARIDGSRWRSELLKAEGLSAALEAFKIDGERISDFTQTLRHCLAQPKTNEVQLISDHSGQPVLLGVMDRGTEGVFSVPVLRRRRAHPMGMTMLQNFLRTCLDKAACDGRSVVIIQDGSLSESEKEVVRGFGFVSCRSFMAKITLRAIGSAPELLSSLVALQVHGTLTAVKNAAVNSLRDLFALGCSAGTAASVEQQLWPTKLIGAEVPTFIVAIRPEWAQHFFDTGLASQLLFGLRDELHLGVEGVYYRSAKNNNLVAPGRVLWYVSKGDGDGSQCIKACSQLEEVVVGKPKALFRRFQRLGVYEWKDVYETAKRELSNDLAAFRFRMTERFNTSVEKEVLDSLDIRGPFMSPRQITEAQFAAIYRAGNNIA